jgi:hypothetical protein
MKYFIQNIKNKHTDIIYNLLLILSKFGKSNKVKSLCKNIIIFIIMFLSRNKNILLLQYTKKQIKIFCIYYHYLLYNYFYWIC